MSSVCAVLLGAFNIVAHCRRRLCAWLLVIASNYSATDSLVSSCIVSPGCR
jgi:hypothetical protein